jgi:uncharacterized protein (DUF927 family)
MTHLHAALRRQHGTAIRAFLAELVKARAAETNNLSQTAAAMQILMTKALPIEADAQVRDVARRFALVALAGELATDLGVLPWPDGEATRAAKAMLSAWLRRRGGSGSSEEAQHLRAIRLFLVEHGASRFALLHQNETGSWYDPNPDRLVIRRAGWRRTDTKGQQQYLIPPVIWREICAEAGVDAAEAARTLRDKGLMESGDGKNLTAYFRIPGMDRVRCYCIRAEIVGDTQAEGVAA